MRTRMRDVRPPTAAATTSGQGMYPSGDWWCSPKVTRAKSCSSAHPIMSSAAA